jgi:AmmeMemoRadiSam system protein A
MNPLLTVARDALEAYPGRYTPPELPDPYREARGVFVTLRKHGQLRGCIGHLAPTRRTLAEEVATLAVAAGHEDSRFPPVTPEELPELDVEISILTPPEPTTRDQLDPRRYGCIVTAGWRRGVLLPDLEGVDTVDDQIAICRRKGGIAPHEPVTLERFEVVKVSP